MPSKTGIQAELGLPAVPLTLEGATVLHQMARVRWPEWKRLPAGERQAIANETRAWLEPLEAEGKSALYAMLGHKADLMLIHFRDSFAALKSTELAMSNLRLVEYLEPTTTYVSVVELGLYDSSVKLYRELLEKGMEPNSPEWKAAVEETLARQAEAMKARLWPKIPPGRYVSFYPMNRLRGEDKNFYTLPIEERQRQMEAHGLVGRRYAGKVQQIITGSIGFDDWEWGVDLFADDPLQFKKLIYEMRFDEVSAVYALFGQFFLGVRCAAAGLGDLLAGTLPERSV
jgi:chlorite dismutase